MAREQNSKTKILALFLIILLFFAYRSYTKKLHSLKPPPQKILKNTDVKEVVNKKEKEEEKFETLEIVGALPESSKKNGYDAIEIQKRLQSFDYTSLGKNSNIKTVFLTFDDGPSTTNTPKVLDILKEYDVKATFCVIGSALNSEKAQDLLKRELNEGHAIGNHTYSHEYSYLYPHGNLNLENFKSELQKTNEALKDVLGANFSTRVVRCPGGMMSWRNMAVLKEYLSQNNMASIDWNALTGDAEGKKKNASELLEYMKKELKMYSTTTVDKAGKQIVSLPNVVVLLMHDTYGKEETVKALPNVIEYFKSEGYEFKILI